MHECRARKNYLRILYFPFIWLLCCCFQLQAADLSLAWDASLSPGITGYKVYVGNSSGTYGTPTTIGNQTTYTITNLSAGTYYIAVTAYDANSNESAYSNEVSTTISAPSDTTPPIISGVGSSSVTSTGATISWTTNEAADTQLEYGYTTAYGGNTALDSTMATSHAQALSGLTAGTLYHYRVRSKDAAGNLAASGDYTFTTLVPADTTPPTISGVGSTSVTTTGATISWTTNEAANTQVEYGATTSYGTTTTLNSTLATAHTQALSGLTTGTLYHYRVRSRDAAGNLATSGDYTFTTSAPPDTTPPTISGVGSTSVTVTGATISWTTNEAADTQVEYGITTSYTDVVLGSGLTTSHTQALSGLTAGTLYHYRVRSRDGAGNLATSGDYTFTTSVAPDTTPPTISGVGSTGVTSTGATVSWTTNEAADTQIDYGTTASYGGITTLNSTMATSHTQALSGLTASTLYHYRVNSRDAAGNLATSGDYTFTTSATPDTTPPTISGVGSASVTSTGATISWTTNEAADTQVAYGTTTGYGSNTTLNSTMATSHTQALIGLTASTLYHYRVSSRDAAGNLATSGDYTFTTSAAPDTTPPTISGVSSAGVSNTGATISWTTNEAADTQVAYGTTTGYGSNTTLNSTMATSHSQALGGLAASTLYHYRVSSRDAAGNLATSGDYTFTTSATPDTTPPAISGVGSAGVSSTGATISWTTNEAADTQVEFGATTSYGTSTTLNSAMATSHSQALSGLTASTLYHYRVSSRDAAGNLATSGDYTFTTSATPDTTPPTISGVSSAGISSTGATISWTTNEAADTQIDYGTTTSYGGITTLNGTMATSHSQSLSGLTASTLYHCRVRSRDAAGNLATSGDYTFTTSATPDTTPPTISGVGSAGVSSTGATISWTTNEAADTQVEYGTTTSYGSSTTLNSAMATAHSQALSGLTASTLYHYRVSSRDAAGNLATSGDYTFTTSATPDTTPPTISGVSSAGISSTGATISWTTNEAADTQVEYGTTTSYGSSTALNSTMATSHTQALSGLTASTLYHYRVKSKDAAGNLATSGDYTFTTSAAPDTTPPTITGVSSGSLTSTGATVSWTTNEAADTQVEYGTTTSYGSSTALNSTMATSHSQALSGLTASTLYHYRVSSRDAAGNLATSGDYTFSTAPDTTPPTITGVSSGSLTSTGATVSWTTNEAADTQVEYGTTTSYGTSTTLNSAMATSHTQALSGLTASTLYHYRVSSRDAAGNLATSGDYTFTTSAPPDTTPPTISDVSIASITITDATISWVTNEDADTQVEYGKTTSYGSSSALSSSKVKSHSQTLGGLNASTLYHYRVKSKDASGNLSMSGDYTMITEASGSYEFAMPIFSGIQNTLGANTMVGIDLTNNDSRLATVAFTAMDAAGSFIAGPDIINPVTRDLAAQTQIPELDYQVFGDGLYQSASDGWIKINSTSWDAKGYFLVFDSGRNFMDGANFAGTTLTDFVFTDVETQGYNKISIINGNSVNTDVVFDLVRSDGTVRSSVTRTVARDGVLTADLFTDLFIGMTPDSTEYVRARTDQGVSPYYFMRQNSGDIAALEGQSLSQGSSTIYAPHYTYGNGYRTTLSVINLDPGAGTVRVRLTGNDGALLGQEKLVSILGYGKLSIEDPGFFNMPTAGNAIQGYVEIVSDGIHLVGSATFSDVNRQTFCTAMPLVSSLQTSMLFNHVISNETYSSQLVMTNPGSLDALVTGVLYSPNGTMVESKQEVLKAKTHQMLNITELFPSLVGVNREKGYVRLLSDSPIAAFMQFNTKNLSAMAVIPPQVVPLTTAVQNEMKRLKVETAKSYFNAIVRSFLSRGR